MKNRKQLGTLLYQCRKKLKLTQQQLATRWGISQSNYSKMENGILEPGGAVIWDLVEMIVKLDLSSEFSVALRGLK